MKRAAETGDPRENPPISGIVRHDVWYRASYHQHVFKPGAVRVAYSPGHGLATIVLFVCDLTRNDMSAYIFKIMYRMILTAEIHRWQAHCAHTATRVWVPSRIHRSRQHRVVGRERSTRRAIRRFSSTITSPLSKSVTRAKRRLRRRPAMLIPSVRLLGIVWGSHVNAALDYTSGRLQVHLCRACNVGVTIGQPQLWRALLVVRAGTQSDSTDQPICTICAMGHCTLRMPQSRHFSVVVKPLVSNIANLIRLLEVRGIFLRVGNIADVASYGQVSCRDGVATCRVHAALAFPPTNGTPRAPQHFFVFGLRPGTHGMLYWLDLARPLLMIHGEPLGSTHGKGPGPARCKDKTGPAERRAFPGAADVRRRAASLHDRPDYREARSQGFVRPTSSIQLDTASSIMFQMPLHYVGWGRGGLLVRLLVSSTWTDRARILTGSLPELPYVGVVPDDAAGRRVFSGISPFPPPFHSSAAPYSPHSTLIGDTSSLYQADHGLSIRINNEVSGKVVCIQPVPAASHASGRAVHERNLAVTCSETDMA
ncbi:hypothetical protein PR048_006774 [Dryococelus australis]|uniref:Uncharacterized protein n=1 Tax=Dryococelus australis TaxID=614101 RepID=A0ABQ9IBV9_9NEOP|nr:hypothetical protein PR048_006774 [Dryococelus australis]